jgi:hypothetical protein
MLRALTILNVLIAITMTAAYFYQLVYTLTGIIFRRVKAESTPAELHRFAASYAPGTNRSDRRADRK